MKMSFKLSFVISESIVINHETFHVKSKVSDMTSLIVLKIGIHSSGWETFKNKNFGQHVSEIWVFELRQKHVNTLVLLWLYLVVYST